MPVTIGMTMPERLPSAFWKPTQVPEARGPANICATAYRLRESDADAVAIVRPHVADHSGSFLRVDTHMANGEFAAFLSHAAMPVFDTVLTMSLGKRLADFVAGGPAVPKAYALASQTLG